MISGKLKDYIIKKSNDELASFLNYSPENQVNNLHNAFVKFRDNPALQKQLNVPVLAKPLMGMFINNHAAKPNDQLAYIVDWMKKNPKYMSNNTGVVNQFLLNK